MSILSHDEVNAIARAALLGAGASPETPISESEGRALIEKAVAWAEAARLDQALLELVIKGDVNISFKGTITEPEAHFQRVAGADVVPISGRGTRRAHDSTAKAT